jgi:uncharacterized lipoprotein YddW (UPF0748 family)
MARGSKLKACWIELQNVEVSVQRTPSETQQAMNRIPKAGIPKILKQIKN